MRIGAMLDLRGTIAAITDDVRGYRAQGFDSVWASQILGYDAMSLLAAVGAAVPDITLGTGVVPVYSRLPQVMAQQALTVQAASAGRFVLGVGVSHQVMVEGVWGIPFDRPARYLREYLSAMMPLLRGEAAHFEGEVITTRTGGPLQIGGVTPPPVLLAALGPVMLRLAGEMADGTITWMTGTRTVADHVVPAITAAAGGRPAPRVVVALPATVTADVPGAARRIDTLFALYPSLPSYRAMLDREGATAPSEISLVGDEDAVAAAVRRLVDAGATDVVASIVGDDAERSRTAEVLAALGS